MLPSRSGYQLRHFKWFFSKFLKVSKPNQNAEPQQPPKQPSVCSTCTMEIKVEPSQQKDAQAENKPPDIVTNRAILENKNVVYIGGFSNVNFECCKLLKTAGVKHLSILEVRNDQSLFEELKSSSPSSFHVHFMRFDPLDGQKAIEHALKKASERMGGIDVLINGSDIINEQKPKTCIQNNLLGPIYTTLAATPLMSRSQGARGGLIVNISSVFGLEPAACLATYSATKHGVIGFTRACAHEHYYKRTGIGHIALCVGFTEIEMFKSLEFVKTFNYSLPITENILKIKKQSVEKCAENIMAAIQSGEMGMIWMINNDKLERVKIPSYWEGEFAKRTNENPVPKS